MRKATIEPAGEPDFHERRKFERTELVVRVTYQSVDELFSDFARDINEGGIFVETGQPLAVGSEVALEFKLPGSDDPVSVAGRVVRTVTTGNQQPGMGVEFGQLDSDSRQRINRLIRNLKSSA